MTLPFSSIDFATKSFRSASEFSSFLASSAGRGVAAVGSGGCEEDGARANGLES